jgi:hypothetical protein
MRSVVLLAALLIAGCTGDRVKSDSADKTANALSGLARGSDPEKQPCITDARAEIKSSRPAGDRASVWIADKGSPNLG